MISVVVVLLLINSMAFSEIDGTVDEKEKDGSHVNIRAVLIRCDPNRHQQETVVADKSTRFEREELFRHGALRDCTKKLALTIKTTSNFDKKSGNDYIPISHVFDGSKKKRVRLWNPYVLRLRREPPLQVYKLRKLDTISGVIFDDKDNADNDLLTRLKHKIKYYNVPWNKNITRQKRHERNILIDDIPHNTKGVQWVKNDFIYLNSNKVQNMPENVIETKILFRNGNEIPSDRNDDHTDSYENFKTIQYELNNSKHNLDIIQSNNLKEAIPADDEYAGLSNTVAKEFDLYDIGDGGVWSNVQLQLFTKLSTPEGKTIWKDITKGEPASVSSLHSEWKGQDMNVRYEQPLEWEDKQYLILPIVKLCLLVPLQDSDEDAMVMAVRDLVDDKKWKKRDGNHSEDSANNIEGQHRRVIVRSSRALLRGTGGVMNIVSNGPEQYLALPHRSTHYAQIEIEAKADENQLVYVGTSGSLVTIVSDNSRRKRPILHVKASNTGLAAARFRVIVRDCGLASNYISDSEFTTEPIMLPPKHTQRVQMELPNELPNNLAHCTVTLTNEEDETVAVRDVAIKKGDRCFCVWHCECVCLTEDPKLICQEMPESRQLSAGLSLSTTPRHVRSICYFDHVTVDLTVVILGVLTIMLFLGLLKALFGLMCRGIASWGLNMLLQMPRKLSQYHESYLKDYPVEYDDEGWPVHPSTKERTVHLLSKPMEFLLNLMFFVILPCITVNNAVKYFYARCKGVGENAETRDRTSTEQARYCCSREKHKEHVPTHTHWHRRKKGVFYKWLTPQAEELTSDVLQTGLVPTKSMKKGEIQMTSLLTADRCGNKRENDYVDSEQDDTDYVLMQMQKSRESLISQRKIMSETEHHQQP